MSAGSLDIDPNFNIWMAYYRQLENESVIAPEPDPDPAQSNIHWSPYIGHTLFHNTHLEIGQQNMSQDWIMQPVTNNEPITEEQFIEAKRHHSPD